jgi:hypothetical protein
MNTTPSAQPQTQRGKLVIIAFLGTIVHWEPHERWNARDGDIVTVRKMLSTAGAQSLINYHDASGATPLHLAACEGHDGRHGATP